MRQDALRCLTDLTESAFLFGNAVGFLRLRLGRIWQGLRASHADAFREPFQQKGIERSEFGSDQSVAPWMGLVAASTCKCLDSADCPLVFCPGHGRP